MDQQAAETKKGYIYATLAYFGWGFFPIYWKLLIAVPAVEILSHRMLWGFCFYYLYSAIKNKKFSLFIPSTKKENRILQLAAVVIMLNWFVYVYAVNSGQIIESSLGYFINPLVNIAVGVLFLKEKLQTLQKGAALLAAVGVAVITYDKGTLPWIALFLALSFSLYGLLKKNVSASGEQSNLYETTVLLPLALGFQIYWIATQQSPVISTSLDIAWKPLLLLVGGGIITGLPLIFFAEAAKRIPFYMLGFFQFVAPSLQFLSGVVLFGEPLSKTTFCGFIMIWLAGLLLIVNNIVRKR
ncbi:MAG: EamA family transporter RarD [Bdellovibrionaceae bacterium]|nr:EamA family transporter RarD [Pseudobdellovibrionaceae bacterium]